MSRNFIISTAQSAKSNFWKPESWNLHALAERLTKHIFRDGKDGPAFVPGTLVGKDRNKNAVKAIEMLIYDIDGTQPFDEVHSTLQNAGIAAIAYSTHSHNATFTDLKTEEVKAWATSNSRSFPLASQEDMADFCHATERGHLIDETFGFDPAQSPKHTEKGICYSVTHRPLDKFRVVLLLAEPIIFTELGATSPEAIEAYKAIYNGVGTTLGFKYDASCAEPARLFYSPSSPHSGSPFSRFYPSGTATLEHGIAELGATTWLNWKDESKFPRVTKETSKDRQRTRGGAAPKQSPSLIFDGFNLKTWAAQYAYTYNIEALMRDRGLVKGERAAGGVFVECHEHGHSGGDQETFAKNGDGVGFTLYCSGNTGGCSDLDRLQHLIGYLKGGAVTLDDLRNHEYGGGEISNRAANEKTRSSARSNRHRVVDRDGIGFNTVAFIENGLKRLDLDAINRHCDGSAQIGATLSADDLAEHVRSGRLTVENIMDCVNPPPELSGYERALRDVVSKKRKGLLAADIDKELATIANAHGTVKTVAKEDFKTAAERLEQDRRSLGVLSADETAKLATCTDFSAQFVIANTGGKAVVLNTYEADLSKALMSHDDFEKLHRDSWYIDTQGKPRYAAADWLFTPPEDARFYRGGLVFKPTSTTRTNVGADQYNLYSGFLIQPDPSGSCDLFHDLLREVWVQGDTELFNWVLEYFMHPLRYPGDKVRTAIAIRGTHGDGKSIVTEKLMAPIYGDMLLRVSNDRMVLGDFNEALAAKLLIALEEAAFAGNKSAFAKMKELVTGDTMLINPKHKAPITLHNYARMVIISNQSHFMDIEHGDRRYTVLNSVPVWKGTTKFEALLDQWNNGGGAARFVYEAMNHSFRHTQPGTQLVINTKVKTQHETKQVAASRLPLEKFLASLVINGSTDKASSDISHVESWSLDKAWEWPTREIHEAVTDYYHEHAPSRSAHVPQLHEIYEKLEEFFGECPKMRAPAGKSGVKGPTCRRLPKRSDALNHAYKKSLITREEFTTAIDATGRVLKQVAFAVLTPPSD